MIEAVLHHIHWVLDILSQLQLHDETSDEPRDGGRQGSRLKAWVQRISNDDIGAQEDLDKEDAEHLCKEHNPVVVKGNSQLCQIYLGSFVIQRLIKELLNFVIYFILWLSWVDVLVFCLLLCHLLPKVDVVWLEVGDEEHWVDILGDQHVCVYSSLTRSCLSFQIGVLDFLTSFLD